MSLVQLHVHVCTPLCPIVPCNSIEQLIIRQAKFMIDRGLPDVEQSMGSGESVWNLVRMPYMFPGTEEQMDRRRRTILMNYEQDWVIEASDVTQRSFHRSPCIISSYNMVFCIEIQVNTNASDVIQPHGIHQFDLLSFSFYV